MTTQEAIEAGNLVEGVPGEPTFYDKVTNSGIYPPSECYEQADLERYHKDLVNVLRRAAPREAAHVLKKLWRGEVNGGRFGDANKNHCGCLLGTIMQVRPDAPIMPMSGLLNPPQTRLAFGSEQYMRDAESLFLNIRVGTVPDQPQNTSQGVSAMLAATYIEELMLSNPKVYSAKLRRAAKAPAEGGK